MHVSGTLYRFYESVVDSDHSVTEERVPVGRLSAPRGLPERRVLGTLEDLDLW
jgi:hypothetical protein